MNRLHLSLLPSSIFFVVFLSWLTSAAAITTEEFIEALTPDENQPMMLTRGIGLILHMPKQPQMAMYLQFDLDSAVLTDGAKETLNHLAEALQTDTLRQFIYRLEGHTCDRGTEAYNEALSERRARAVQRYLTETFAIAEEQLEVAWFGESRPAVANTDEAAREQNRRVMIVNTMVQSNTLTIAEASRLQIRAVKEGREILLEDGGTLTENDSYAVEFTTSDHRYVYLFQKDSAGKLTPIFPNPDVSELDNPLEQDAVYRMPRADAWFFLDEQKGEEEILMITSPQAIEDPVAIAVEVTAQALLASTRGLGGIHRPPPPTPPAAETAPQPEEPAAEEPAAVETDFTVFRLFFIHE